jgi:Ser/Thr protein kinase RdoA (MazF antagonist)
VLQILQRNWQLRWTPELARFYESLEWHASDLEARYAESGHVDELVIHGDFYGANLILSGGAVVGVVDYDLAHWGARAMEVAEALIYFARELKVRFEHIVYSGLLDLGLIEQFLASYTVHVELSAAEVCALPHLIRTIWLCAALDPPLRTRISAEDAPNAMPEVLALADWAADHASEIAEMGLCFARARHQEA